MVLFFTTLSQDVYHFQVSLSGSGTMTVRKYKDPNKETSVFAAIMPNGKGFFFVESCGENCTVLYMREHGFFNNLKD